MALEHTLSTYDAIFVGSGHNALVAAAYLAKDGKKVLVLERNDRPGGFVRSDEILPGFLADSYSAAFPLLTAGPAYADLGADLEARGLHFVNTDLPSGVSLADGTTAILPRSLSALMQEADRLAPGDRDRVAALLRETAPWAGDIFSLFGLDMTSPEARMIIDRQLRDGDGYSAFAGSLLDTARHVLEPVKSPAMRSMLAAWVAHVSKGPDEIGSGIWLKLFLMALMNAGMPIPIGGSERLAQALVRLITDYGGEIATGEDVDRILLRDGRASGVRTRSGGVYEATRTIVASVSPIRLYGHLLADEAVPAALGEQARRFRYGRGCVQINLALSEPPRWPDERFALTGQPFLTDCLDGHALAVTHGLSGALPSLPTFSVDCPTARDPSRAPPGKSVMRVQVLDVPCVPVRDAADGIPVGDGTWSADLTRRFVDRVLGIVERHIPNIPSAVLGMRVETPATIAAYNVNAGPGDPYGGAQDIGQLYMLRPLPGQGGHRTYIPNLYMVGAATWPGAGVSGNSGFIVANAIRQSL